ncbi:MAG: hypothetical protein QM538_03690 [Methylacidiphilales bacterium]|nr:hypothetical protein [Candidatus Methylacidiphilales bacterium]
MPIKIKALFKRLGQDIANARKRRRIPVYLMAERTNLSKITIAKIEKGSSTVSMGGYALVLFVLGLDDKLFQVASYSNDTLGAMLEEEQLPKRIRLK